MNMLSRDGNSDVTRLTVRAKWTLIRTNSPVSPDYAEPSSHTRYNIEHRERGQREAKQSYLVATDPPITLEQFGFPEVEYVIIQNHQQTVAPATNTAFITWTDDVTGDIGRTRLIQHAFIVIPNPRPYDAGTGLGGIVLEAPIGETIGLVVVTVGKEA